MSAAAAASAPLAGGALRVRAALTSEVIDRMPVILHPKDDDRWLERDNERPPLDLLRPFESEQMVKWACNPLVGNFRNNGPEMLNSA